MLPIVIKRFIPGAIRSLPWRYRWIRGIDAYRAAPLPCIGKLARWTLLELMGKEATFATSDGHQLRSMSRNFSSLSVYLMGESDPDLQAFIAKHLKPGSRFLDIGANVGIYTLFASRIVGATGRVLAIEAHPATFAFLEDNVLRNNIQNVTLLQCAVGDQAGALRMTCDTANAGQTHVSASGERGVTVPVEVVDDLLPKYGFDKIDYMKIDVEGFELPVLKGCLEIITNSPDIVIQTELVQAHARRYGFDNGEIIELLTGLGLKPFHTDAHGNAVRLAESDMVRYSDILWMR